MSIKDKHILQELEGKDLRSIGNVAKIIPLINSQSAFDELFKGLFHENRLVVMRSADAIEKITSTNKSYLKSHENEVIELLNRAVNKELKWHLALLIPRINLTPGEAGYAYEILSSWLFNPEESRIVRVNSLQGMYELTVQFPALKSDFSNKIVQLEKENIPSLRARIKKLKID